MARTPELSDLQLILLTAACQRVDGSLLPPPESIGDQGDRIRKAVAALLKRRFAEEVDATDIAHMWREEDDRRIGVIITDNGRAAIGAAELSAVPDAPPAPVDEPTQPVVPALDAPVAEQVAPVVAAPVTARPGTKQALLIDLLQRKDGASITELTDATGWLPHTTRAALTGLRKRGLDISRDKIADVTRYSIAVAA